MENVLEVRGVTKVYNRGEENEIRALDGIDIEIKKGEFVSIIGPSGSGKTTLLDIIGCLMKPTDGRIFVDGIDVAGLSDSELARIRGKKIGFVFQQYNLIPSSTALENVSIALRVNGTSKGAAEKKASELLGMVGLSKRLGNRPSQLSGGEQQRVAIARALANSPKIMLSDEPTGNLDTKTGAVIIELFKKLNRDGYTIVIITHDQNVASQTRRTIKLLDGKVVADRKC